MINLKVLYEDNHLIAVYKPAGVLSQPDTTGDESLFDQVKQYLKEKYQKPGNVFLGLVHRLDRPACGIVLFAKTSKGASRLSKQFRDQTIEKKYQVIVCGKPKNVKGILKNFLIKDEKLKKAREAVDGKKALLYFEILKTSAQFSLLNIEIDSGQFHQIRTQLTLAGLPILGDKKYGGQNWHDERAIALCASEIAFQSATGENVVRVKIELPKEWQNYIK